MGGAVSKNVANAVAEISANIQAQAGNVDNLSQQCQQNTELYHCLVEGSVRIQNFCNLSATAKQLATSLQQANVQNSIAQSVLQKAQSLVGSLGVGYADASNVVSTFAMASTNIINDVFNACTGINSSYQNFKCDHSTIYGDLDIANTTVANFIINQISNGSQSSSVISDITQTLSQTASATVQGLAGFLIALAILIIAIGWTLTKPITAVLGSKVFMILIIAAVLIGIFALSYAKKWPPFFNDPTQCSSTPGVSLTACDSCIDVSPTARTQLKVPPVQYALPLIGTVGANAQPGLLPMAISAKNSGAADFTDPVAASINTYYTSNGCPSVLMKDSGGKWQFDYATWTVLTDKRVLLVARYLSALVLNIPVSVYVDDFEANGLQSLLTGDVLAAWVKPVVQFQPDDRNWTNYAGAIEGSGYAVGPFGVCSTNSYRLQQFIRGPGKWILLALIAATVAVIFLKK
eukprot:gnl/Hemi2/22728_TR7598_c0_g1_i1.p1 gnl/Hemi2/22728_TR7598_c0_g1~~gnl/Hemi2/22728_TR7598_c0_g1_i1.p1  ORF type:complete len:463 (+),score=89.73 gnl/Hemi2/22728_TR7598_c0_g1_i1:89-1477(+)